MRLQAKFVHVNLVARDWRKLATFYEQIFGCTPMPPERHLGGQWLEEGTGVPSARIQGMHLRLPGCGKAGPTLEIFQYTPQEERQEPAPNQLGLGHLAFSVDDVHTARQAVILAGGGAIGEVVSATISGAGRITFAYVTDPEGNIIELQRWEH